MDDYSVSSLQESRNEWCARLINILTPLVIEGFKSIFDESWKLCEENDELEKYLMTYQNFLVRIPKWNPAIVTAETNRIVEKSKCGYLTDLISCVHIIQLKSLTCMRVGNKQKKIDINIPTLTDFVHKIYINAARKIYTNIYLFEKNISPLQIQKHNRELELIIREQILNTIRENIPVENILKVYLDETIEDDTQVEETEEIISTEPVVEEEEEKSDEHNTQSDESEEKVRNEEIEPLDNEPKRDKLRFNDIDNAIGTNKKMEELEQISRDRNDSRKLDEHSDSDDDGDDRLKIGEKISLTDMDIHDLERPKQINKVPLGLEEIEILA